MDSRKGEINAKVSQNKETKTAHWNNDTQEAQELSLIIKQAYSSGNGQSLRGC
jgi:hypothetical protein